MLTGIRALVVDDAPDLLFLVETVLRGAGAVVTTAVSGLDALTKPLDFDVALIDIEMPEMDGFTLACELQSRGVISPLVAVSAHAYCNHKEKARRIGFAAYVTKPFSTGPLLEVVTQVIRTPGGSPKVSDQADRKGGVSLDGGSGNGEGFSPE
jgi:CheY-like chemotaxis protein